MLPEEGLAGRGASSSSAAIAHRAHRPQPPATDAWRGQQSALLRLQRSAGDELLLAEGRTVHYVAGQLGHGAEQTLRTYGHVIAEWEERTGINAENEIRVARDQVRGSSVAPVLPETDAGPAGG